jgi:hypothetical protein
LHFLLALIGVLTLAGGVGLFINATALPQEILGVAGVGLGLALWALAAVIDSVKTGHWWS